VEPVTPVEREAVAFEIIEEAFAVLKTDTMAIGERLHGMDPAYNTEDVIAVVASIKEAGEMFHEVWSMGCL
jgi:hypothetical protein